MINTVITAAFTEGSYSETFSSGRSFLYLYIKKYVFHLVSNEQPEEAL